MAAPLGLETREQKGIFLTYMSLWVSYGLLNELAKRHNVSFNSTSAVVLQSFIKLGLALYMYLTSDALTLTSCTSSLTDRIRVLFSQIMSHKDLIIKYFIPSGLYVVYDVLSYVNLRQFDAATYFLLLQFRMVITGLLHQFMFKKPLNRNQWISLGVTTIGCAIKTLGTTSHSSHHTSNGLFSYLLLLIQMLSSTFAGVYNEVLLKKQVQIPLNLQNIFMYSDSILCTLVMLILGLTGQSFQQVIQPHNLAVLFSPYVFPMVLIMSFIGVVTSLFLKQLDSIRKAIASALELVVLPLLSAIFFGLPLTGSLILSVAFVATGVYIYSKPVQDVSIKYASVGSIPNDDEIKQVIIDEIKTTKTVC